MNRVGAVSILVLFVFSAYAWPQTEAATVFGTVTDPSGAVIAGAQVTILNQSTGLRRDLTTDSAGQYHVAGLPIGNYSVRVGKEGFQTQVRERFTLTSASSMTMNFSLAVGSQPQEVTVSGDINEIDITTSSVSRLVAQQSLNELPLNGRDLFKAAIFAPGVAPTPSSAQSLLSNGNAGQISINGMRPSWTDVRIDGMDANDPVFGYSPAGASGLFLGLNEFTEVRLLTQTFDVENGALTVGTRDGATIEMAEEAGEENLFLFGLSVEQVENSRSWYSPEWHYEHEPETRAAIDLISSNYFSHYEPGAFELLRDTLLLFGDRYMHLADLKSYVETQERLGALYRDPGAWAQKAILNAASSGKFSADRTIHEYTTEIWKVEPCPIP